MRFFPNAKINLGLNVIKRRKDGFHNLESVFVPIQWKDELEIIKAEKTSFVSSGIEIPGDNKDNLCLKAYFLLKTKYDLPPVRFHLKKNIPIGAGLGGGSADASYALKGLNDVFGLKISDLELQDFARLLGSDCAFFIKNETVFATDKGDVFHPIDFTLKGKYIVLVYPNLHVSTADAYGGIIPQKPSYSIVDYLKMPQNEWKEFIVNDFEATIFKKFPELQLLKTYLYERGAFYASMSGSGSTIYGLFVSIPPKINYPNSTIHISKL